MNKNLILLTNFFPFGSEEPYLGTEVKFYDDFFDNIYVCSLQLRPWHLKSSRRPLSAKFKVLPIAKASNLIYLLYAFRAFGDRNLYRELRKLIVEHRLTFRRIVLLFVYLSRSYYEAQKIRHWLMSEGVSPKQSEGAIYAYRFEYQPYVALMLKQHLPNYLALARGHRFDLYEERRKGAYIPLREYLLDHLDSTVMIAENGVDYLSKKYPGHMANVVLSRLGTTDYGLGPVPNHEGPIRIVSCSTITCVKRVGLIVEALSLIRDVDVVWEHFGDGNEREQVEAKAEKMLPSNIEYKFHGNIDNKSLMKVYSDVPFHVFLNVSASEGIPVSIMEAMSFGIPTIATDVGGTAEIVIDGQNGFLLPSDFEHNQLVKCIMDIYRDTSNSKYGLRHGARKLWESRYKAEINYPHFISRYMQRV